MKSSTSAIVVFAAATAALIFAPFLRTKLRAAYSNEVRPLAGNVAPPRQNPRYSMQSSIGEMIQNITEDRFALDWPGTKTNLDRVPRGFYQIPQ